MFALPVVVAGTACSWPRAENDRPSGERVEPWAMTARAGLQREQIRCSGTADVTVSFTPTDVTVARDGEVLAHASLRGRSLSRACVRISPAEFVIRGSPPVSQPIYDDAELACRVPQRVLIQVHPILEADAPAGSVLLVVRPDRHTVIASAPLKEGGSRISYDTSTCRRLP